MVYFIGVAVIIIVLLAIVAYRLQSQVNAMEAKKREQEAAYEAKQQQQRDSMNRSIQILAQGLVEDQLTKTEAAIRISALLEFLQVDDQVREEYSAMYQLAQASAHIPILDKWKALSTKEKLRYDNERASLEEKYGDFVVDAAKRILGKAF